MNKKQEYQLRLARVSFSKGDIFDGLIALTKASWFGFSGNDTKKIKPAKFENKVSEVVVSPVGDKKKLKQTDDILRASIYNWGKKPELNSIPFGYVNSDVVNVDFSRGDILFVNDIMRKNINTLFAGLTRVDDILLVGANDPINSLVNWEKHFSFIGRTKEETSAVIASVFFMLEDRKKKNETVYKSVFLFVNNIHTLTSVDAQRVKSILEAPKHFKVNLIGNVDKKNYLKVEAMFGSSFEYTVTFDFTRTTVKSSVFTGDVTSYSIPNLEIKSLDRNFRNSFNAEILSIPKFFVYNTVLKLKAEGVAISDKVSAYLFGSKDYYSEINSLTYDEAEEFMKLIMNNTALASAFNNVVDDLAELLVIVDTRLAAGKPVKPIPKVVVTELELNTKPDEAVRAYTKTELDKIFEDTVRKGFWQEVAKTSKVTLTDDQLDTIESVIGVKSLVPRASSVEEPEDVDFDDIIEDSIQEGTTPKAPSELNENQVKVYMLTTGVSRAEAIAFLTNDN